MSTTAGDLQARIEASAAEVAGLFHELIREVEGGCAVLPATPGDALALEHGVREPNTCDGGLERSSQVTNGAP